MLIYGQSILVRSELADWREGVVELFDRLRNGNLLHPGDGALVLADNLSLGSVSIEAV